MFELSLQLPQFTATQQVSVNTRIEAEPQDHFSGRVRLGVMIQRAESRLVSDKT